MQKKRIPDCYLGKWVSDYGQVIVIRKIPLFGYIVNYYPAEGRPRFWISWFVKDKKVLIALSLLVWLEAMLLLQHTSDVESGKDCLVPELESGPESNWGEEGFGFSWVLPLGVFRKDAA